MSDELLVKLLRVDDEGAFQAIYQRHWKSLFKAAQQKLKSDETAEELLQDVFLRIWEKRATQQIDNLTGYLFGALKYRIIDHYRTQFLADRYTIFALHKPEQPGQTPDEQLAFQEIISTFDQVLGTLPQKTAQIFRMSRLEFRSTRDIAQALQLPERTVEYHITQALKQLRIHLSDYLTISLFVLFYQI